MSKKNQELAAAKAKKQKTILIVGGVLLLAVAAFQGPKLLKRGSTSDAAPAATSVATGTTPATASPTSTSGAALIPVAAAVPKGSASIAGVALPNATAVKVTTSQLASFTLFEAKDPFVQQEGGETGTAAQPQGEAPSSSSGEPGSSDSSGSAGTASTGGSSSSGSAEGSAPAAPAPVTYATITFNGSAQQVQAKDKFPVDAPLFVLRSLKQKTAKIGVAGGSFDDGHAVTLKLGKKVTLVNTATGVRYVIKLVYTGAQPEVIQSFTKAPVSTGATTSTGTTAGK